MKSDKFYIAEREFSSRLILGTGKFSSLEQMKATLAECGTSIVTVALKRIDLTDGSTMEDISDYLDRDKYMILPNTSGAASADEAVRIARLGRVAGFGDFVKLEIHPDPNYLLPDPIETLEATKILVKEGFKVMPYINADPVLALRLQEVGAVAVMPLGAPIGTNRGVETRAQIEIIIEQSRVPVVVEAGLGLPSHAAEAMEIGADAVMINTAVAFAKNPLAMAKAFAMAVEAGRCAYLNARSQRSFKASPTSPLTAFLD